MFFRKIFGSFIFLTIFCQQSLAQNYTNLSLEQYLNQVQNKNITIAKGTQSIESFELLKQKAKLVNAIKLYGFAESSYLQQNNALQFFRYKSVQNQNSRVGFSQDSLLGVSTNVYLSLNNVKYNGFNNNFNFNSLAVKNSQTIPVIELKVPLWQNFRGTSSKASFDATFNENEAQKLLFQSLSLKEIIDAEKAFWNLVYAQRVVEIQNRALNNAQKILDYLAKKAQMNLAERSDVLQAKTMVETKKLAVKQAENFLKISAREFNKKRNIESDEVFEKLISFDIKKLQNIKFSTNKKTDRLDIKAQKASMNASIAQAKIEEENNKPSLNLYASYSVNQVKPNTIEALSASLHNNAPARKIGLEFSIPINLDLSSDIRKGARTRASAEKTSYKEKLLQQEVDWQNLQQNLIDFQQNLNLAKQIEQAQKAKLENERELLQKGRTSTYQVLVFEQDYSNSELNTQQIAQKLHELIAEQKLYQSENQPK